MEVTESCGLDVPHGPFGTDFLLLLYHMLLISCVDVSLLSVAVSGGNRAA